MFVYKFASLYIYSVEMKKQCLLFVLDVAVSIIHICTAPRHIFFVFIFDFCGVYLLQPHDHLLGKG